MKSEFGDRSIPDNATTKALEALGATINFIDIQLTFLLDIYNARCDAYINAIKYMFKEIPQNMKKSPTPRKKSRNS